MFQYELSAADGTRELKVSGLILGTGTTLRDMAGNDLVLTNVAGGLSVAVDHQASGAPAVASTATRGEVLAASVGTLTDPDGLAAVTCHWERDD
ncbi:hypothetical protein, partial [Muricoccus vinaceus]